MKIKIYLYIYMYITDFYKLLIISEEFLNIKNDFLTQII